jgi:hypothetical protein
MTEVFSVFFSSSSTIILAENFTTGVVDTGSKFLDLYIKHIGDFGRFIVKKQLRQSFTASSRTGHRSAG